MLQNYNSGAVSRALNGNQIAKTSKMMQASNENYNFMARGKTVINEKRARSVLSTKSKSLSILSLFRSIP